MEGGPVAAPREQRWTGVLLALGAVLLLPLQSPLNRVLPIDNMLVLLVPLVAACFVVGWWAGGSLSLAVVWVGLAAYLLTRPPVQGSSGYHDLARAWGLLVAGSFGIACVAGSRARFLPRALAAIGIAAGLAIVVAWIGDLELTRVRTVFADQFAARRSLIDVGASLPGVGTTRGQMAVQAEQVARQLSLAVEPIIPALLALQALGAAGLAWALYHRLSRARLGAPLGRLRDFRFSDQLIWGLIAGIVILVLPTLASLRVVGANLVVLFGALYVLRGLGVMAALVWLGGAVVRVTAVVLGLLFFGVTAALAFGIGVGDMWLDVRSRLPHGGARPLT